MPRRDPPKGMNWHYVLKLASGTPYMASGEVGAEAVDRQPVVGAAVAASERSALATTRTCLLLTEPPRNARETALNQVPEGS